MSDATVDAAQNRVAEVARSVTVLEPPPHRLRTVFRLQPVTTLVVHLSPEQSGLADQDAWLLLAHDEDGPVSMPDHRVGDAAHQGTLDAAEASAPLDDKSGLELLTQLHDLLIRSAERQVGVLDCDPLSLSGLRSPQPRHGAPETSVPRT